jgi:hypothetical protein
MSVEPLVEDRFQERWAAWQKRSDDNDRTTRRTLFVMGAILALSGAILSSIWWL